MALTTLDDLAAAPRQYLPFGKTAISLVTSAYVSAWTAAGNPTAGAAPSSGVAGNTLTDADTGGISFVNPASGLTYLVQAGMELQSNTAMVSLYDRLWHNSGLSTTLTTSQTVNSVALPSRCPVASDPTGRTFDTNGAGVEAWWEIFTVMGAGTVAPTITYTDDAGNTGNVATAQNWLTAAAAGRTFPFDLLAGDRGVRSIQAYQQTATQTSGAFSLVLRRRLATFPLPSNVVAAYDWSALGAPVIPNDAHLEILVQSSATSIVGLNGGFIVAQG